MDIGKLLLRLGIGMCATWLRVAGQSMCSELNVTIEDSSAIYTATSTLNGRSVFEGDDTTLWWMWFTDSTIPAHAGCDAYSTSASGDDYYWHLGVIGGYGYVVGDCATNPADISSAAVWEYYSSDGVLSVGVEAPDFSCVEYHYSAQPTPSPSFFLPGTTSAPTSSLRAVADASPSPREEREGEDAGVNDDDNNDDDNNNTGRSSEGIYGGVMGTVWGTMVIGLLVCVLGMCGCCCWARRRSVTLCCGFQRKNRVGPENARPGTVTGAPALAASSAPLEGKYPIATPSHDRTEGGLNACSEVAARGGDVDVWPTETRAAVAAEAATGPAALAKNT